MSKVARTWTQKEKEMLKTMYNQGCSRQEMSEKLGRTVNAVQTRLNLLGVTRKDRVKNEPLPLEEIDMDNNYYVLYKGEEILTEGTAADIAHQLGINTESVYHYGTASYGTRGSGDNVRALLCIGKAHEFYY